uniref:Esophageal gland-localized secretory protein 18 n=1 Tax=Heterodera glycines TaxID=51029 RepID=A0A0E3GIM3_HETGL|nr:esophageal gland-localized secretory protein 18 [Heterodera glycines]
MAILLKCVLLLSIMAIFCDCMDPGKKGKSKDPIPIPKQEGKPSSSAANSPTVTKGTPKRGKLDTPEFYKKSPKNKINSPRKPNNGSPRKGNNKKALQKERQEERKQKERERENRFLRTKSTAGNTTDATDVETESEVIPTFVAELEDSTVEYPTDNDHVATKTDLGRK